MALGFSYGGTGGGADFLPIVKFDARGHHPQLQGGL